jgi:hypothetical protein
VIDGNGRRRVPALTGRSKRPVRVGPAHWELPGRTDAEAQYRDLVEAVGLTVHQPHGDIRREIQDMAHKALLYEAGLEALTAELRRTNAYLHRLVSMMESYLEGE